MFSDKTWLTSRRGGTTPQNVLTIRNREERSITNKGYKGAKIKKL